MTAERIRDKVAASRRKGMWMGGVPPYGYRARNRKLVVDDERAEHVRWIFARFLEIGPETELAREVAKRGIRTPRGNRIDKKYLYRMLNNRAYIGEAVHKGQSYPGEHEAIIDHETWDRVHTILQESPRKRAARTRAETPALLIRDDAAAEQQVMVDLGSLLARVCDDLSDAGADVDLADIPRWVLVDCRPIALRRALGNLVENAVKYGDAARVSLRVEPDKLAILIDDDGPGIPADRQEAVFQPFHRLDDSRNRETGGTGLGLAVARTIVRAHGGDIRLGNRTGGGLRVEVNLPRPNRAIRDKYAAGGPDPVSNANAPNKAKGSRMPAAADAVQGTAGNARENAAAPDASIKSGAENRLPTRRNTEWKTLEGYGARKRS